MTNKDISIIALRELMKEIRSIDNIIKKCQTNGHIWADSGMDKLSGMYALEYCMRCNAYREKPYRKNNYNSK